MDRTLAPAGRLFAPWLVTFLLLTAAMACSMAPGGGAKVALPRDANALSALLVHDDAGNWPLFPGTRERMLGSGHHGALVTVRLNEAAGRGPRRAHRFPPGSLLVITGFSLAGEITGTAVMAKVGGFDAASGDWFFASFDALGNPLSTDAVQCAACHRKVRSNDMVFSGPA